ncbi:MAG TPA: methylated-DNA--[protein]-cysteine S-methyltransferase [Fluviicola sp.]|nr:methylated-DNA--[protein]-cysteine S-methyltransferase [Fluviicola sp.]
MHILTIEIETPLGLMIGGATEKGVCFIEFTDRVKLDRELERLKSELNAAAVVPGENIHLIQLKQELDDYFERRRTTFDVKLHLTGTPFQQSVWKALCDIPYGKTWSYKQQAIHMNNLMGIRAIAAANGQNKHAIVIPCHRVIGSNGNLTGYAGGLPKKDWLLKFEGTVYTPELPFGEF